MISNIPSPSSTLLTFFLFITSPSVQISFSLSKRKKLELLLSCLWYRVAHRVADLERAVSITSTSFGWTKPRSYLEIKVVPDTRAVIVKTQNDDKACILFFRNGLDLAKGRKLLRSALISNIVYMVKFNGVLPDRTFLNFGASKSVARRFRTTCNSLIFWFWGSLKLWMSPSGTHKVHSSNQGHYFWPERTTGQRARSRSTRTLNKRNHNWIPDWPIHNFEASKYDVPGLNKICRPQDIKALTLWKGRSGSTGLVPDRKFWLFLLSFYCLI